MEKNTILIISLLCVVVVLFLLYKNKNEMLQQDFDVDAWCTQECNGNNNNCYSECFTDETNFYSVVTNLKP